MAWHPGHEQLVGFRSGQLSPEEAAAIERHLAECDTCKEIAAASATVPAPPDPEGRAQAPTVKLPPEATPAIPPELRDHPRYRILKLLGKGGMGAVFQAQHKLMERIVALKVISRSLMDHPASVERFRQEVKAAARLSHPNIVTAYDAEQVGDLHFLVMEYVEGRDLANVLRKLKGPLPAAHACEYARQAAEGLQHAHQQGMVHRDIKPQNLMLTTKGQVKILDFGLARFASERETDGPITASGAIMGSPDFIAPEQITNAHDADIRADIYSLGCTMYTLLTCRVPFPEGNAFDKMVQHTSYSPKPLAELRPDLPVKLIDIVNKMMSKDRRQRYQTPAAVKRALASLVKATIDLPEKLKTASDSGPLRMSEPTPPQTPAAPIDDITQPPRERTPSNAPVIPAPPAEEPLPARRTSGHQRRRRQFVAVWTVAERTIW
jgi:serine/threonine protein kinase